MTKPFIYAFFSLSSFSAMAQQSTEPFPVLIQTGNPQEDADRYAAAKAAWIEKHPAEYQQMTAPKALQPEGFVAPAPTGDAERDKASYLKAKNEWLAKNKTSGQAKTAETQAVPLGDGAPQTNAGKFRLTRKYLDQIPEAKRNYILAHPEQYEIVD